MQQSVLPAAVHGAEVPGEEAVTGPNGGANIGGVGRAGQDTDLVYQHSSGSAK